MFTKKKKTWLGCWRSGEKQNPEREKERMRASDEWTTKTNCKPVPLILLIILWKETTLEGDDNGYPICISGALKSYDLWIEDDDWIDNAWRRDETMTSYSYLKQNISH